MLFLFKNANVPLFILQVFRPEYKTMAPQTPFPGPPFQRQPMILQINMAIRIPMQQKVFRAEIPALDRIHRP